MLSLAALLAALPAPYVATPSLAPGLYACAAATEAPPYRIILAGDGSYVVDGFEPGGALTVSDTGAIAFLTGPLAPDAATGIAGQAAIGAGGTPALALGFAFADGDSALETCDRVGDVP